MIPNSWMARFRNAVVLLLVFTLAAAASGEGRRRAGVDRLLVILNTQSSDSVAIAMYYNQKHHVPPSNIVHIACPEGETCSDSEYRDQILGPIKSAIAQRKLDTDYLLLTKGIPIRVSNGAQAGYCVDSLLAMLDWSLLTSRTPNPYFAKHEPFSHQKFRMYLVTRLDGYTRNDCLRLVDNALQPKTKGGTFLFHIGPGHETGGYKAVNDGMRQAHALLSAKGLHSVLSTSTTFAGGYRDLLGYFSWGSNDGKYDRKAYNSLSFLPGAIAETAVSTSGRTFSDPNAPGQSLIADLIAQGVTGCKGYVSEPYADAIAHADILFDRYTSGYNLAESFYAASYWANWKDIVIGDPLCAPYASAH